MREHRRSAAAFRHGAFRSAIAVVVLVAAGCVDVDGELRADGSFHLRYTYDPPRHATYRSERARLSSAAVRVEALEAGRTIEGYPPGEFVTATLAVAEATALPTAAAFADVGVTLDRDARRLVLSLPGLDPETRARAAAATEGGERRAVRVSLLLPEVAVDPEPTAVLEGRRVTWTLSVRDYAAAGDTVSLAVSWGAGRGTPPDQSM
jgi:hypothetical protein